MMKERAWVRSWLSGFLLVVVLGHVQAQGNGEQLEITSFTPDTSNEEDMRVVVCFTDHTEDASSVDIDSSLVKLTCAQEKPSVDEEPLLILTSFYLDNKPNYCSTHQLTTADIYQKLYCILDATDTVSEPPVSRIGSAEFQMPDKDSFPECTTAYNFVDQLLVGVECSADISETFTDIVYNSEVVSNHFTPTSHLNYALYSGTLDPTATLSICAPEDNTASDIISNTLDICTTGIAIQPATSDLLTITSSLLTYGNPATLHVTVAASGNYDLILLNGLTIKDALSGDGSDALQIEITDYAEGHGPDYLVVKTDTPQQSSGKVTFEDYNLRVIPLTSSTLEMTWDNHDNHKTFLIEITTSDPSPVFVSAIVECLNFDPCYGYFVKLESGSTYSCSLSVEGETNKITSAEDTMPTSGTTSGFSIRQLTLKWNSELNSADTSVCFDQEDATTSVNSSYLELIMINSQGQMLKSHRTTQTMQGILCFVDILIETSAFNLSEGKVNVVVLKRDVNSHNVLTSGEAELFLISPEIKVVGARGGRISWDNPGGYSITTMMEGRSTHLAAPTTGRLRRYFSPKKTEERLVVEADASGVKMTAVVPLTSTGAAESIVINEIVLKKQENNVDICYEAIPTPPTVDHAEITIIKIFSDSPADETNVASTASTDNCVTFDDPALSADDNIVLELQLYSSTDSSSLLGQGSIAFIMEDYQDLAACTSVSKFSDGMYRLVCDPVVKDGDNIMVDNTQMDILGSSDYEKNTHYVILKDVPTDAATLKVYRDISDVTVNDDTKGPVRVTRGAVPISDAPAPSDIFTSLTLAYETPRVEGTLKTTTSTNFDIVSYWTNDVTDGTYNVAACPNVNVDADSLSCDATEYTTGTSSVNVLLVGFTDPDTDTVLESDLQTLQDYYITGSFVTSSTIEWQWTMEPQTKSPVSEYLATILPEESDPSPTFITAKVTCDTTDTQCYVFFLGLTSTNHYAVMIQPKSGDEYDSLNQIISEKVTGGTSASRGLRVSSDQLRVEEVELDWRRDGVRVDVGVCFHHRDVTVDDTGLTQYQLVLVDSKGRWHRVHGASHTREGRLCFSRVTLDSRQFNTAEEVAVLVIKRDVDGRTVLASGESHVFFIRGSVDSRGSIVSWNNPGNYTFTLYKEGQPHPLATSLTCHTCTHSLTTQALGEDLRSVLRLETQDSTVKLTARIPQDVSFTDMTGAITINYMTFPITKSSPSGASVPTLLDVKCDTAATEKSSFILAFSVPESVGNSVHEYNDAVDVDKITQEPMNVTFENMQDYAFVPDNDVTVFVMVQDSNRVVVDFGYAEVKLRDPEATSYRVGKKLDDSYEGLRITYSTSEDGDNGAQLGYDDLCKCDNSPCYCLGSASVTTDPQTLCLQLKTANSEPTVESLLHCTDGLQADDSTTVTTITGVKMTYLKDGDNVDVQVDVDSSNKVELLFYEAGDTNLHVPVDTCDGTTQPCTMNYQFTNSDKVDYSVLVVTVDSDQAVDSALLSFKDYKPVLQQLSSDVVEVRFSSSSNQEYKVNIDASDGTSSTTTVECSSPEEKCNVFFTTITSTTDNSASVEPSDSGDNNVVALQFDMNTDTSLPKIIINSITVAITSTPSGTPVSTVVGVQGEEDVSAVSSLTLAVITPDSGDLTKHYIDALDVTGITTENIRISFENIKDNAFLPSTVTVMVAGHDDSGASSAFGYVEVTLSDPQAVVYKVGKTDNSYEGLRITYSPSQNGAQLGYDNLCKCDNSPCYCLGSASVTTDPQTLCLQLKTTNSEPTVESLLHCTDGLQAHDSSTVTTITGVKMTYLKDSDNVDVQVDVDSSNKVELLFYEAEDTSLHVPVDTCDGTKQSCTMNYQLTNSDKVDYSVLVVTVDSKQAVDSALLSFEDYKTTVQQLTSDAVEVRFSAKTDTTYRVDMSPNGGAFDYTTLDCGGEQSINCDVFFIMMTPGDYTAIVKQDQEGENNVVAADFTMGDAGDSTRDATLHLRVQGNQTYLSVCVDGSFNSTTPNYTLVIIYRENKNIMTTSALQETTCFPEVLLTLQTNQQVKVLILTDEKKRHVVRETDIYLLDPLSAGESISHVGSKTLKAIWNNRNQVEVKYLVGVAGEVQPVECPAGQECIQYIHLNSTTDKKNVTLEEHNQDTVQVVSFQVEPQTIPEFPILDWSIRWDDHLRVCFSQPTGAASYELGLQKGVQHLETTTQAPIDTQDTVETCVLSTGTIDVGAYIDLWMLVIAYDFKGNIIASGEHTWSAIFLSSGYRVQAAIKDSNIIATWHLIDDVSTIDNFNVILRSVNSESTVTVSSETSTYVLNSVAPGTYAVCVNAMKQLSKTESVQSEEVCSDILVVSDTIADVPHVEEVEPKSTAETSVLVTWQRPVSEDVSAFYVTWTNQSTPARRSLGSPRLPPQSLTRSYMGLQGAVPGVTGMDSGFTFVPASYTSLEVTDLQQGAKYTFCVSSIKNDVVDQDSKCSVSDLGSFEKLDPPEDLSANEKALEWSGTETSTYLVEWFPNEKGRAGNEVVTGTTYTLNVTAGTWNISVRTVTSESSSDPRLNATHISGLISSPKQSGSKVVEVVWWEVPTPQADSAYVVTLEDGEMPAPQYTKVCSGDSRKNDCSLLFTLNVDTSKVTDINVSIQRSTLLGSSHFKLEPIEQVSPALNVRSANEVEVEWQKVDNAKYYIVSLYQDDVLSDLRWRKQQTLPLRVTIQEDNLMGNHMTIQACVDSLHCGDIYQTSLMQDPSGDKNRGVVAGVVGGVLGAVLLVGIIFIVMKHNNVKRKERLEIKSVPREEEMTPRQNVFDYDEWGARRLGQPPVAQITVNVN